MTGCPYPGCTFEGSDDEVDEHRVYTHRDEAQAGSNERSAVNTWRGDRWTKTGQADVERWAEDEFTGASEGVPEARHAPQERSDGA